MAMAAGARALECPCTLVVTAVMPIAPSWPIWKQQDALEGRLMHTTKPDWDNLGKIVSDALNLVAWKDDSQVFWANVKKLYGVEPRMDVTVTYTTPALPNHARPRSLPPPERSRISPAH